MKSGQGALLPILLIVFADVLGFAAVIPLLPLYAERYGAAPATVGLLLATYALCALFAAPLLGRWSDRYGRRRVLLLSQSGSMLGFVLLALAPSLAWLFAARALDGLTAGNLIAARACIADRTAPQDRAAAFGYVAAAFGFGYMVGPTAAALLATHSPQAPLWAGAALSGLSLIGTLVFLDRDPPHHAAPPSAPWRELLAAPEVALRMLQWFAFLLAFSLFTAGFALYCERRLLWQGAPWNTTQVGLALGYVGLLGLLTQLLWLRPLVRARGEAWVVRGGLLLAAAGYAGLGLSRGLWLLLASLSLCALANNLLRPALLGLLSHATAPQRQGAVFGLGQSVQSLAMLLGPLAAGGMIHLGWLTGWALSCAAVLLAALALRPRG